MVCHSLSGSDRIQFSWVASGSIVDWINQLDTFLLTMAMAALGAETSFDKFKKAGIKPFLLAAILYGWLIGGGYCLVKFAIPYL